MAFRSTNPLSFHPHLRKRGGNSGTTSRPCSGTMMNHHDGTAGPRVSAVHDADSAGVMAMLQASQSQGVRWVKDSCGASMSISFTSGKDAIKLCDYPCEKYCPRPRSTRAQTIWGNTTAEQACMTASAGSLTSSCGQSRTLHDHWMAFEPFAPHHLALALTSAVSRTSTFPL